MATFPVADQHYLMNASLIAAIFSLINLPSAAAWACFGISMRRFLRNSKSLRYFNLTMATLVVCTIIFMFY
jgi:threonine/homoserine/homoserine lactone efflux protein